MDVDLTDPIFHDEDAARAHFEKLRWPDGPVCPHCGVGRRRHGTEGQVHPPRPLQVPRLPQAVHGDHGHALRAVAYPADKWLLATHLMSASKKGIRAHQLHRMLGVS